MASVSESTHSSSEYPPTDPLLPNSESYAMYRDDGIEEHRLDENVFSD
ncbi:unnamed protein product [Soboliphyme baturini]|uniref:Uncharacterized protein n=1 Tax=Soboliphyme baturini TaxID=241478 RepID=A0A183JBC4_9BILA|nr:unnamed protein product [Soboliphyme baturini]